MLHSTHLCVWTKSAVQGAKDAPTPRPNKRPRLGPSPYEARKDNREETTNAAKMDDKQENKKTQLDEFMRVMQPSKGPSWANEQQPESANSAPKKNQDESGEDASVTDALDGLSDLDWMKRHMSKTVDEADKVFEQDQDGDIATVVLSLSNNTSTYNFFSRLLLC